jgi:alpha-L-fucosidase
MKLLLVALFLVISFQIKSQDTLSWQQLNQRQMPQWFAKAKFGIFIHWGVYAVPSWATNSYADGFGSNYAEWYWQRLNAPKLKIHQEFVAFHNKTYGPNFSYTDFANQFKAEMFDADQWANIFKNAGAKYVVLTSKHHDGYAMWNSAQSWNWNVMNVGPKKDVLKLLTDAVRKTNLKMGYYYSLYEWYNPVYLTDVKKYVTEKMLPQMKDLVTNYKPDILWTDGEWEQNTATWRSKEFIEWLYNASPVKDSIIINDRWGSDSRGKLKNIIQTSEYGSGKVDNNAVWEETRGIGQSFGYNRNESLAQYASSKELIHQLIKTVSKGGNLLLNVGPTADGRIPVIMQQRLADIGNWLKVNGIAIYNTTGNVSANNRDSSHTFFTKKENAIFAIATNWTKAIQISDIAKPKKISLIGYDQKIAFTYKNNKLIIATPNLTPDVIPCNDAWVYLLEY